MKLRLAAITGTLLLGLAGCESLGDWIEAGDEAEKIPGERISVMSLERQLDADPRLAGLQVVLPRPYVNEEWPQPGGFADNVLQHLEASGALVPLWDRDAGAGTGGDALLATALVAAEGRIFVLDAEAVIRAFDSETGSNVWRADLTPDTEDNAEGRGGGVAYEAGRLFVTTGFGEVVALDAATGEIVWRMAVGIPYRAAPTVNNGRIFTITSDNQTIVLSTTDGRILWQHQGITEAASILIPTSPAVSEEITISPYSSGELYALRVENGNILWSDSLTRTGNLTSLTELNDIAGRPVIDRNRVYAVSHSGRFVAIDMRTGERIWTRDIASVQTPWVAGDFLFAVTTNAEIVAISGEDGRVRWATQLPAYRNAEKKRDPVHWSGPVLAGDRLVLVSSQGKAVSVSPYDGKILDSKELSDNVYIAPIVARETLYILTDNARLIALR